MDKGATGPRCTAPCKTTGRLQLCCVQLSSILHPHFPATGCAKAALLGGALQQHETLEGCLSRGRQAEYVDGCKAVNLCWHLQYTILQANLAARAQLLLAWVTGHCIPHSSRAHPQQGTEIACRNHPDLHP